MASHQSEVKINVLAPTGIWNDSSLLLHIKPPVLKLSLFETLKIKLVVWTKKGGSRTRAKKGGKRGTVESLNIVRSFTDLIKSLRFTWV